MSHLRAIQPEVEPQFTHDEATKVFRTHLRAARSAWVALCKAQASAFLAPLMFGENPINRSEARIALREAETVVEAAHDLRNAMHSMATVYDSTKPSTKETP